jgi:hypothetical protein
LALSTAGRLEATQQLERIVRSEQTTRSWNWSVLSLAGTVATLMLVGLAAGAALAWIAKPASLLSETTTNSDEVPQQATVQEQFLAAQMTTGEKEKEEAFLAVERYFPPAESAENRRYGRMAKRRLANLYFSQDRLKEAAKLYEQLENVEDTEIDFQLSGMAGQVVVYHRHLQSERDPQALEWLEKQIVARLLKLRMYETELDRRIGPTLAAEIRKLLEESRESE